MTEDEKKLIQARHRLEAVQARNRQKEPADLSKRARYWKVYGRRYATFRWLTCHASCTIN